MYRHPTISLWRPSMCPDHVQTMSRPCRHRIKGHVSLCLWKVLGLSDHGPSSSNLVKTVKRWTAVPPPQCWHKAGTTGLLWLHWLEQQIWVNLLSLWQSTLFFEDLRLWKITPSTWAISTGPPRHMCPLPALLSTNDCTLGDPSPRESALYYRALLPYWSERQTQVQPTPQPDLQKAASHKQQIMLLRGLEVMWKRNVQDKLQSLKVTLK